MELREMILLIVYIACFIATVYLLGTKGNDPNKELRARLKEMERK